MKVVPVPFWDVEASRMAPSGQNIQHSVDKPQRPAASARSSATSIRFVRASGQNRNAQVRPLIDVCPSRLKHQNTSAIFIGGLMGFNMSAFGPCANSPSEAA